ncbi:MAG: hypothetical protein LBM17_03410 [Candidatus Accumulibacter sp.]|jgi:hypothetical protein|nr:hypothetical protein [Accumulibacter sp.]
MHEEELLLIFDAFERKENPKIPKKTLLKWMRSDDIEILASLYEYLLKPEYVERISPPLCRNEFAELLIRYFDRCIRLNLDVDWCYGRYEAGWDLVNWFAYFWKDREASSKILARIKAWLASLYKNSDEEIRLCIVNATLEHLFEKRAVARYFSDWKKDPVLAVAYAEACEWTTYMPKDLKGQLKWPWKRFSKVKPG